jgi:hypothetical protein
MEKLKKIHTGSFRSVVVLAVIMLIMALFVVGCSSTTTTTTTEKTSTSNTTSSQPGATGEQASAPTGGQDNKSITKNECSTCHEMWPEVATWQTSVHANVPCLTCHKGYKPDQNKAAHDGGAFAKPIIVKNPVTDDACRSCHAMENRDATLLPDLIAPHEKHAAAKVSCLSCHRFTTHGNIGERKVTTREQYKDYSQWTPDIAKKAAPGVFRRPNMFVCINCHEQRKVTTECAACHYYPDRKSLPSHEDSAWKSVHGKAGRDDVNNCAKCHYDKESQKFATPTTGDLISDFARANTYCYNCHNKRPINHDGQWMSKHPQMALAKGMPNCLACHDKNQPGPNVTGTYCNTCHWFAVTPAAPTEKK